MGEKVAFRAQRPSHPYSGMHAVTKPPMIISQGDQKMLHITDYHPRCIGTQDVHLQDTADSHKGLGPLGTTVWQKLSIPTFENILYAPKDIPLSGRLWMENTNCMLGEDMVAVFVF